MKRLAAPAAAALSLSLVACGGVVVQGATPGVTASAGYQPSKESQDTIRKQEKAAAERAAAEDDAKLARAERDALTALEITLGRKPVNPSSGNPPPASVTLKALAGTSFKLKVEPVTDSEGNAVGGGGYLQLTDSGTKRLAELGRKAAEHRASPAEMAEMQAYSKSAYKLLDVKMQFLKVAVPAFTSNSEVQTLGLTTMLAVSSMVRARRMFDMELDDEDYAGIRARLERLRRAEAIAAAMMGVVAAYEAVVNDGGDPKAIDVIADSTFKAFPLKPSVTDEDARAYVADLKGNVAAQKAKYERMLRGAYGDARYEKDHKAQIDAMFKQAEDAQNQKSIGQMQRDIMARYDVDLAKCARGEDPGPGSPIGGGQCKAARSSGASVPVASGGAGGGAADAIGAAAGMLPSDSMIGASLNGVASLMKGDPRGAIGAALSFVPGGSLVKEGLSLAFGLLFGSSKT